MRSIALTDSIPQLKDKSLFIEKSYINGEWVGAQSGETFEVHGNIIHHHYQQARRKQLN
jgi:succinate-semialdehyde dehydrogenase/glutarate-semialdehyde dehydrogenase